jgi:integrase/recombinase XerD
VLHGVVIYLLLQYSLNRIGDSVLISLPPSTAFSGEYSESRPKIHFMLYDQYGKRKYLTKIERESFMQAAGRAAPEIETFCLTLAYTGARISEVLALVPLRVDTGANAIIIECLKKRRRGIYRAVPVPRNLLIRLNDVHDISGSRSDSERNQRRIWNWSRTTAWNRVKTVMRVAGIIDGPAMPKALRHAFGVGGTQAGVPLNLIQRWLGHSDIETTAIYTDVMGEEERALADRMWGYRPGQGANIQRKS